MIVMASTIFHASMLAPVLKCVCNGFIFGPFSESIQACPFCTAPAAFRMSHLLRCGGIWVFLHEHLPGLPCDFLSENRWRQLYGSTCTDSDASASVCLAIDTISAEVHGSVRGSSGWAALEARWHVVQQRPGAVGRIAGMLALPLPDP
jgi:hypothetical protein